MQDSGMGSTAVAAKKKRIACLGFVLVFSAFSLFYNLGGRSLENHDGVRYAECAREILETGDWVMMHLGGRIYVDKPPLHFWIVALSYRLFGVNAMAARVPSAVFGLIGVLATLFFAARIDRENRRTAIHAASFLVSAYGYALYARTSRIDVGFAVLFSLCLVCFYLGSETDSTRRRALCYAFSWFFMGCAFLDKGPAAFLALPVMAVFLFARREKGNTTGRTLSATSAVLLLTILPWIVLLWFHKDFDPYLSLLKSATIMTRKAGFFYYFPEFFKKFFPGAIFLPVAASALWRGRRIFRENSGMLFCLIWAALYLAAIHLTSVRNHRYLLPAYPPLAVLAAWGTARVFKEGRLPGRGGNAWKIGACLGAGILCIAVPVALWAYFGWRWGPLILSLAAAGAFLFAWKVLRDIVVFTCTLCLVAFLFLDLGRTAINPRVSDVRRLYSVLQERDIRVKEVLLFRTPPGVQKTLSFYYNHLVRQKDDFLPHGGTPKAIVTPAGEMAAVRRVYGSRPAGSVRIRDHRDRRNRDVYVVFPPR